MVTSLAAICADQAKRRASNAAVATALIRSASLSPPMLPAHPPVQVTCG
jgi:hypothetical protein